MPTYRRALVSVVPVSLIALAGCGDDGTGPGPSHKPQPVSITAGDYQVRVDAEKADVALLRGSTVLLDLPAEALALGAVPELDDTVSYDPYVLLVPSALHPPPDGLEWLTVEKAEVTEATDAAVTVALTYPKKTTATLHIEARADGRFEATLTPDGKGAEVAFLRLGPRIDGAEGLYGLGEYFDDVNHRGKVRGMQIELDPSTESLYNEAHVPIPFLIGTNGWGLFVESPYPGVFAVATEKDDLVEATFGTGLASVKGLRFHLFGAGHPLDVTKHYYDVTGKPRLPARWALGPWVWRDENEDQAEVMGDLQAMRDLDLPASGYWIDRPYATAVNTFDFNPAQFPDPAAMIGTIHDLGFRTALWHTPYLDEKAPETQALRDEATAKGYYPKTSGVLLNGWGRPIDLTNEDAFAWWQDHVEAYTSMGVEGFKLDYGEDVIPGIATGRNVWEFADGSDERTMHAQYQLHYHRVYAETLPEEGGFLLCRRGTYGDQTNVSVIWPGDLDASFARHGEMVSEGGESYVAVGGLAASMIAGLSLGPSGFPFYGADTGGYRHSPPDKELFTRWFQQTALSTVMQIGNSASTVAWEPDAATGYDDEMLGWYRTYTRLHLRLFPYEWTYAQNLANDGRAIQRPLGLAFPELGVHPSDEYMFGDWLLVAPVLDRGAVKREVLLPKGSWIDWWSGEVVDGGGTVSVDAPLDKLPLFLREGGIVPMLRPTIDSMAPTADPALVDSYATTPGVLWARIATGSASSFTVFDGAEIAQERTSSKVSLSAKGGAEFTSGVVLEVIAFGGKPAKVTDNGAALTEVADAAALYAAASGWRFAPELGGTVEIKVAGGAHAVEIPLP